MIRQKLDYPRLDVVALVDKAPAFGELKAERTNGVGVRVDGQAHSANRSCVNI